MNDLGDLVGVELSNLESKLLHVHIVLMAISAWFILWALSKMWKGMDSNQWVRKFKPLYPLVLCEIFIWIPGIMPDVTTGERILMAVWAGILAAIGYQVIRRIVKKVGVELPEDPAKLTPSEPPPPAEDEKEDEDDKEKKSVDDDKDVDGDVA